jgi:uncharacterized OsmC-like protein
VRRSDPVGRGRRNLVIETDAPLDKLDQLLKLAERYCVVYQTLRNGSPVDVRMRRG